MQYSKNPDEIINQILPLVEDKLDGDMVEGLLYYSKNRDELINQILPLVKDKLDDKMLNVFFRFSKSIHTLQQRIDKIKSEL